MNSASRPTAESPRQEWDGEARQELSQARATIRMLEGRLDKWCKDVLEDKRHAIMLAHRHVQEQEIAAAALVKEKQTSQQKLLSRLRARTDANAQGATAQGANAQGATPQGANAQGATAQGANAQGATAQAANTQGATPQGANAQGATPQGANAQGATAQGATAQAANTQGANAQGATPQGANAQGATAQAANTQGATPQGANAQGATAQAANTQGACGQNSGSATNSPLRGKHASRGQDNSAAGLQAHRRPRRARDDRGDETDYDNEADDARGTSARAQFVRLVSMQERMIEEREKRDQPLQEHSRIQKGL